MCIYKKKKRKRKREILYFFKERKWTNKEGLKAEKAKGGGWKITGGPGE